MTWLMGLDLGQSADYTALSIIEYQSSPRRYTARHLQRFALGTSYLDIVDRVIEIRQGIGGGTLCIDATGVGRPVLDLFYAAGLTPVAITITGGDAARSKAEQEADSYRKQGVFYTPSIRDTLTWSVPKRDLVGAITVALQQHQLKISASLPDAKTLVDEMMNFRIKISTKTGHDSYEAWREGVHDDLVLAVALPLWWAMRHGSTTNETKPGISQMTGQALPPVPDVYAGQKDKWGRSSGFSFGDIGGIL